MKRLAVMLAGILPLIALGFVALAPAQAAPVHPNWSGSATVCDNSGTGPCIYEQSNGRFYTSSSNPDLLSQTDNGQEIKDTSTGDCLAFSRYNGWWYGRACADKAANELFTWTINSGGSYKFDNAYAGYCLAGEGNGQLLGFGFCTNGGSGTVWGVT